MSAKQPRTRDDGEPLRGTVLSLRRGLQLLEAVVTASEPPRLTDLARAHDLDKAAAHRFLKTLEQAGLVSKEPRRKTYVAGSTLLHWASSVASQIGIVALARPYLEGLVQETGESGHIGILHNDQALLLDYIPADAMVVVRNRVGVYEPLHATAVGKALLAFQPDELRREILKRLELHGYTANTLTTRERIEAALAEVRETGIALDDGEYHEILYCVASPVLGPDDVPVGAIGVSMVKALLADQPARVEVIRRQVRDCGAQVTAALAGSTAPEKASHHGASAAD